ncbi:MAG: M48 family metalloprotease [Ignavibacteriales bacterium]|nr:M48 family metalloprotease [Ignavibacteriales bacterium]
MNFLYQYLPEELVNALGRMIFHSFWQGAVIAFALGLILFLSGKKSARSRYIISVAAIILFVTSCVVTFSIEYKTTATSIAATANQPTTVSAADKFFVNPISYSASETTIWDSINTYFNQNLPLFVMFWLSGLFFFSLRFIGSVLLVQKMRTRGINELDVEWLYRSREIGKKLGIKKFVAVFESINVKVPLAIGYIKPIILLPLGMINGLPYTQVEALIAHEFAHIKRYDFVINLIQTLVETIFFYHPAVWWISNQIREERENCCDDITVNVCGDSFAYSKALYNLLQIQHNHPELALAASGKVNQLLRRIKRMNGEKSKFSYGGRFAAFMLVFAIVAAVLVLSSTPASSNTAGVNKASIIDFYGFTGCENVSSIQTESPDTASIKKGKHTFKFSEDVNGEEKRFKAKLNNGKLEELYIDGDKVDAKDFDKYESKISSRVSEYDSGMKEYREGMKKFREEMKAHKQKLSQLHKKLGKLDRKHADFDFDFDFDFPNNISIPEFDSAHMHKIMAEVQANLKEHFAHHSVKIPPIHIPPVHIPPIPPIPPIHIDGDDDDCDYEFDKEEFEESMKEWKKEFEAGMKEFNKEMKHFDSKKLAEEIKNSVNSKEFKESMKELKVNMSKLKADMKILKEYLNDVKDELVKDKLVNDEDDLDKFYLSKTEMKVNGKVVSPELHKKYLQLYKKHYGKDLDDDQKINF